MGTVHPPSSSQSDHKTNKGQENGPITSIYKSGPEAQREVNISKDSLWRIGKSTELNRFVSRKVNIRGKKSQALEVCPGPHSRSSQRSIPAPGGNLLHWPKLLLSHRPPLKTIGHEISHHKSMNTSKQLVKGTAAGLCSRQPTSSRGNCQTGYYFSQHLVLPCFTMIIPYSLSSSLSFLPCLLPTNADSEV